MKKWIMVMLLAFVFLLPTAMAGDQGEGYNETTQEIRDFSLERVDHHQYSWDDGENVTVLEGDNFYIVEVTVTIEYGNASSTNWAKWHSDVDVVIKNPGGDELENSSMSSSGVTDNGEYYIVTKYEYIDVTADTSGYYSIEANYTVFSDETWTWVETSTTYFLFNETEEEPPGSGAWGWLDSGGILSALGIIGFFGMIGCPALFIFAARHGADKFQSLVYLVMSEATMFVFFMMGI